MKKWTNVYTKGGLMHTVKDKVQVVLKMIEGASDPSAVFIRLNKVDWSTENKDLCIHIIASEITAVEEIE